MANDLFTLGLNVSATKSQMDKQLKQIAKELSDSRAVQVTGGLNLSESQKLLQSQLNTISKNLKVGVEIDTSAIKYQKDAINKEFSSGIKSHGVKIPFQFDLSDANAVKTEINKIVADITKNQGSLIKYKINVDENGQASRALLTYRNELNEVINATLKLKNVGSWYDASGVEHHIVKWAEGHKTLSQNIEATARANQRQIESDNQVIRKKQELIAQMKLLTTQAEKAGLSLNSDNKNAFDNLSVSASTMEDIKQLESYLRLARTEYQTFNATISKGTHASSLEAMRNTLQNMPNDIALLEARFNSIKMPDGVKVQIEQLKSDLASINSISEPSAKIAKYNELVSSLQSLQKQYQIAAHEQRNLNADTQAMQSASILTNRIITWMGENRNAAAQYDTELKKIIASLQNVNNKTDLTKLEQQFRKIQTQTQATDATSLGFFGNLKEQLKTSVATMFKYQLAYKIINGTTQALKSMVNEVCELDSALVEFNKVADVSSNQLEKFTDKAFEAASRVGGTGKEMIQAATEFKRAGEDIDTSLELGEVALMMTNIGDGIESTEEAASILTSVLRGFNKEVSRSEGMKVLDSINSVSNQSPVDFDNIADGLKRVSGTMNQAGNSIDETIGMLTGGFSQLRNMEKVSTGLITISQRLRAVDEDGNKIDGLSAELSKSFGEIGVAIEDADGNLRSTYDILHDYAQVFPTLTSAQRQYFGELAAGKRQVNVFNAIVDEMATVDTAINQSIDSVGSAAEENERWRQGIEGTKKKFQNQFQILSKTVIDSDWMKDLISAGTDFLAVLTNIIKQEDIMSGAIGVITDLIKGLANILKDISGNDFIGSMIKGFLTFKTVTKGIDIFNFFKGKSESKSAMDAFFKSAMNGTLQLKDGFIQVGNAEKEMVKNTTSGLGNFEVFGIISWRPKKCATPFKVA